MIKNNNIGRRIIFLLLMIILSSSVYSLSINGTFSDATNYTTYIYNASIKLYDNSTNTLITQNNTDVFGRYKIDDPLCAVPKIYRIEYDAVGFIPINDTIKMNPFPPGACSQTIRKDPHLMPVYVPVGNLLGNVKDNVSGDSIGNANVELTISDGVVSETITSLLTGSLGDYNVSLSPNVYNVTFEKSGYYPYNTTITITQNITITLNVNLVPVSRLGGQITDLGSGVALGLATVEAYMVNTTNLTYRNETISTTTTVTSNHGGSSITNLSINSTSGIISLYGNNLTGEYISKSFNVDSSSIFSNINWLENLDPGTSLRFQVAYNTDNTTWNYVGSDGTSATYYVASGSALNIPIGITNFRYKVYFDSPTFGLTPTLSKVDIGYSYLTSVPNYELQPIIGLLTTAITGSGGEFALVSEEAVIKLVVSKSGYYNNSTFVNLTKGSNEVRNIGISLVPTSASSGGGGGGGSSDCNVLWTCTEWSECYSDGTQTRVCIDEHRCGVTYNRPVEEQDCIYYAPEKVEEIPEVEIPYRNEMPIPYAYIPEIEQGVYKWETLLFNNVIYGYKIRDETDALTISNIYNNSIDVLFYYNDITRNFELNKKQKVDLDDDGELDYIMTVTRIGYTSAIMDFVKITWWTRLLEWLMSISWLLRWILYLLFLWIILFILYLILKKFVEMIHSLNKERLLDYYIYLEKDLQIKEATYKTGKDIDSKLEYLRIRSELIRLRAKKEHLLARLHNKDDHIKLDKDRIKIDSEKQKRLIELKDKEAALMIDKDKEIKLKTLDAKKEDISLRKNDVLIEDRKWKGLFSLSRLMQDSSILRKKETKHYRTKHNILKLETKIQKLKREMYGKKLVDIKPKQPKKIKSTKKKVAKKKITKSKKAKKTEKKRSGRTKVYGNLLRKVDNEINKR